MTCAGAQRLARPWAARAWAVARSARPPASLRQHAASPDADGRRRGQQREIAGAAQHVVRVVAHDGDARRRLDQQRRGRTCRAGRPACRWRARGRGREQRPQFAAPPRQVPGEQPVILREAVAARERVLPDRALEALGQADDRRPALGRIGAGADDERRRRRGGDELGELATAPGVDGGGVSRRAGAAGRPTRRPALLPVAHRHHHERRARATVASCQARAMAPGTSAGWAGCVVQTG